MVQVTGLRRTLLPFPGRLPIGALRHGAARARASAVSGRRIRQGSGGGSAAGAAAARRPRRRENKAFLIQEGGAAFGNPARV